MYRYINAYNRKLQLLLQLFYKHMYLRRQKVNRFKKKVISIFENTTSTPIIVKFFR